MKESFITQLQFSFYVTLINVLITTEIIHLIMMDGCERGKNRKGHMGKVTFSVFPILQQIFLCCAALYRQYYHFSSHTMFKSAFFPRIKPPTVNILI